MKKTQAYLDILLNWWSGLVLRLAWPIVVLSILFTIGAGYYTSKHLGINTDVEDMISDKLPFRQIFERYKEAFPQYTRGVVIVIDADKPEFSHQAAKTLLQRLQEDSLFSETYMPAGGKFIEEHGLYFLDIDELQDLTDDLAKAQPFLASLYQDQSLRGLFTMLDRAVEVLDDSEDLNIDPLFQKINRAIEANLAGEPYYMSWQETMANKETTVNDRRRYIFTKPYMDFSKLLPAAESLERIRTLAADLDPDGSRGIKVRITGGAALGHEELLSLIDGTTWAGIASLVLVLITLFIGLRSFQMVAATFASLIMGIILTAAFATVAIGHLNLISVAFAVLYIGLGVDYAIHVCLRYRAFLIQGAEKNGAITGTIRDIGPSLILCAISTSIGFYAFVPTAFVGVSELGLISGSGMFISLAVSLTVLPACLKLLPPPIKSDNIPESKTGVINILQDMPFKQGRLIRWGTAILIVGSIFAIQEVTFEYDSLKLRDPNAESVQVVEDIIKDSGKHPSSIIVLAKDDESAIALSKKIEPLNTVDKVVTIHDFVPKNQEEKEYLIEELDLILGPGLLEMETDPPPTYEEQIEQINSFLDKLKEYPDVAANPELVKMDRLLRKLISVTESETPKAREERLGDIEDSLLVTLPISLGVLQASLHSTPFTRDDLPEDMVARWVSKDGEYRIQVTPNMDTTENEPLERFVEEVRTVAPDATSGPVFTLESGRAIVSSFQQASIAAVILITLILLVILRSFVDTLMVLIPLLLAGLFTGAATVTFGLPFNFANIITLPLLLGLGVDNGIHMVHRIHQGLNQKESLLETSTARGIFFSAITTICSFGTLGFLAHRGTASMGQLLTLGVFLTLAATLIILPAFIYLRRRPSDRKQK